MKRILAKSESIEAVCFPATGDPWPAALGFSRPDGSTDWTVAAFSLSYTVITSWLVLQVKANLRRGRVA